MPELPEIQAHAERLEADFGGAVLERFTPLSFTALKTYAPAPEAANGRALSGVGRRGKHLLLRFDPASAADGEQLTFVVHLMQGGRLKPDVKQSPKARGGVARWRFADGRALLLTEAGTERKAGVWVLGGPIEGVEPLAHLGPDADTLTATELARLLSEHPMRLHGFLRDQRIVAGLGRRLRALLLGRLAGGSALGRSGDGRHTGRDLDQLRGSELGPHGAQHAEEEEVEQRQQAQLEDEEELLRHGVEENTGRQAADDASPVEGVAQ